MGGIGVGGGSGVTTPGMCHHGGGALPPPPPPAQALMSGGGAAGSGGGLGMFGSHMSLGGLVSAASVGDTVIGTGHYRSMSGLSQLSVGGGPPPPPPPVPPPPPLFNPCSSNSFNTMPTSSRWGPRTSCPVHSPFRVRVPNGSICSGHQVSKLKVELITNG